LALLACSQSNEKDFASKADAQKTGDLPVKPLLLRMP
jgi:hypothetical protein